MQGESLDAVGQGFVGSCAHFGPRRLGRVSQPAAPASTGAPTTAFEGMTVTGMPDGYIYMVTRYADVILRDAFPAHWADLLAVLNHFRLHALELWIGGGGRSLGTQRFDKGLHDRG